ncbi:MAG TPA: hypothetical protein VI456_03850, partial [Polyangia bacterium]
MKPREGSAPDLARAAQDVPRPGRPRTEELGPDDGPEPTEEVSLDGFDVEDTGGKPRAIGSPLETAQVDLSRDRRVTITSPIPAQIAEEMLSGGAEEDRPTIPGTIPATMSAAVRAARDPAAPQPRPQDQHTRRLGDDEGDEHHTRRVGDSDRQRLGAGSGKVTPSEAGIAASRQRASALIDEA